MHNTLEEERIKYKYKYINIYIYIYIWVENKKFTKKKKKNLYGLTTPLLKNFTFYAHVFWEMWKLLDVHQR